MWVMALLKNKQNFHSWFCMYLSFHCIYSLPHQPVYWWMYILWCTTILWTVTNLGQCSGGRDDSKLPMIDQQLLSRHQIFCHHVTFWIDYLRWALKHNSWQLVSVDFPFFYFLGEKLTPVLWKVHTTGCLQFVFIWKMLMCHRCPHTFWCLQYRFWNRGESADAPKICMR